ncbi:TPA: phage terminase small subunit P27 family [Pasteurella multocida]|nr:phage terminase small subunit P27 family [Pasteurella multocida]HDR1504930.1 phage terminase small subunit P27 family [Pasteurella multocida]HDR1585789.1 phage terminase small subunit P27 family [Pasteurella multocida]HDR1912825.1 phage terminase small subunit P27 family [Pasteurella multocida]
MSGKALISGRGRKPKPTVVKKRQGNPGKRKLNDSEPAFSELSVDTPPPDDLNNDGAIMWQFVLKELCPQGIILKTDLETVANYCIAYQNRKQANADIEKYGSIIETDSGLKRNPAYTTLKEATADMAKFGSLLGLDPSSRSRLVGKADNQPANPFAELLQ